MADEEKTTMLDPSKIPVGVQEERTVMMTAMPWQEEAGGGANVVGGAPGAHGGPPPQYGQPPQYAQPPQADYGQPAQVRGMQSVAAEARQIRPEPVGRPAAQKRRPAPAPSFGRTSGAGGLAIVGGIGMFLTAVAFVFLVLQAAHVLEARGIIYIYASVMALGLILGALGYFACLGVVGGVSVATGIVTLLALAAPATLILALTGTLELRGTGGQQLLQLLVYGSAALFGIFQGIWGFASSKAVGAGLGVPIGILGLLGGLALAAVQVLSIVRVKDFWPGRDLNEVFLIAACGALALACFLNVAAFFKAK